MLQGLSEDKLVPPEIISDRYLVYRVPEFLQAWLDYTPRPENLPPLPYEKDELNMFFKDAGIFAKVQGDSYIIANLAKAGVTKIFNRKTGELLLNDCGIIGKLQDGSVLSSQWIDPDYQIKVTENGWVVKGFLNKIPSNKLFNPTKNIIFRSVLVMLGWSSAFSHFFKGQIRKMLILGKRQSSVAFTRELIIDKDKAVLETSIENKEKKQFESLSVGDEFFVRYVPQSRYFQHQELEITGWKADEASLNKLNKQGKLYFETKIKLT